MSQHGCTDFGQRGANKEIGESSVKMLMQVH